MSLLDHLWSWSAEDLSYLMEVRPDLLPASDRGLEAVARKAGTAMSLGRVLVGADVGMLVVAEALVAKHPASVDEIAALLGTGDVSAVVEAVERLRRTGVVVVDHDGERGTITPVGSLRDLLHRPLGLGPSFSELAEHLPEETIANLAGLARAEGARKRSATVRAIGHRLADRSVVDALLAAAPAETRELFEALVAKRSPAIALPTGYPYRGLDPDDPLAWLVDAGLVVPVTDGVAELPRELVMATSPDGLAPGAALRAVELVAVDGLSADVIAGAAAAKANRALDGAELLLRLIGQGEVSVRKAGGIGPRELRRLAKVGRLDPVDVARLLELLAAARLVKVAGATVTASELAARWWSLDRHRRHLVLVRAWMAADRFLSRGLLDGTPEDGREDSAGADRIVALGDREPVAAVAAARVATLTAICELGPGRAFGRRQLAEAVVWQGPNLWGAGEPPPEVLIEWMVAEAELLGLVANDAAGDICRALIAGDETAVMTAAAAALTDDQDRLVLQNDLTAISFGPLAPAVARSLSEMTERVDGPGASTAPTFRFTETSIRRAFDRGWDDASVTAFLTEHSLAGVPQPLEYLVADVARRYGTVRVMPSQSVIVTSDEVGAVEIATNRKATSLGLRLVAPTVLTSPLDPVTVVESLRALGLFPVLDGSTVVIDRPRSDPRERPPVDPGALDLPADWTGPPVPTGPFPDEVSEAVAQLTAIGPDPDTVDGHGAAGGAELLERPVTTDRLLRNHWGRSVVVDAVVGATPQQVRGTLVGLNPEVAILTTTGVVELPIESVVTVTDPTAG